HPPPTSSPPFPYTTLFRSKLESRQPEQLASLMMGQRPRAIAFDSERFQRLPARIGAPTDIVRQFDRNLHEFRIADFRAVINPDKDRKSTRLNSSHQIISYA